MAAQVDAVFRNGNVAVLTGSSSGIGLAVARKCASAQMHVVLVDRDQGGLAKAHAEISALGALSCTEKCCDVSSAEQVALVKKEVLAAHSTVHFLYCNAGTIDGGNALDSLASWQCTMGINMWGIIQFCQAFIPAMLEGKQPGIVVNTGSKQGVTLPPGTKLSYNVSKAAVKAYTEGLQHELRNIPECQITAHLMVPAFVYSMLVAKGTRDAQARAKKEAVLADGGSAEDASKAATDFVQGFDLGDHKFGEHVPEIKPADAWTSDETADFVMRRLREGSFYLVQPEADEHADGRKTRLRMTWSMNDLLQDRPPMSRWEEGHKRKFEQFMADGLAAAATASSES